MSLLVGTTIFHAQALGAETLFKRAYDKPPSSLLICFARVREALDSDSVANELSVCCRDEDFEEEAEEEEKWWKNIEAEEGRCSLQPGVASMIDAILPAIQPCSNVVDGKGTSGWLYCTKVGASLTAAIEPRYAAVDVLRAEVKPKPP